jgi:predicted amidohydrolase
VEGICVASVQLAPVLGDLEGNHARVREAVERAACAGAELVVVPELATSGYVFADAAEARRLARPADEAVAPWVDAAQVSGTLIAGGFAELGDDDRVYNAAALVSGDGVLAVYRKLHLWDREKLFFASGQEFPPVVETPLGRIGLCVCYDVEFPEVSRGLALRGAELVCVPTNWPDEGRPEGERPMEVVRVMAAASINRLFIAAADRCGAERSVDWVGASVIASPGGWLLAGPATSGAEALLVARCDLAEARDKRLNERNDVLADRRPEVYAQVLSAAS